MEPEAPPRLSTTNVCPICCPSWAARIRATWSTDPPGGNTAMISTGCEGQAGCCAWAASAARATQAETKRARTVVDRVMGRILRAADASTEEKGVRYLSATGKGI